MRGYLGAAAEPEEALAVVCPHAGYMYSASVVGKVLGRVKVPRRVVVLGPNHQGLGQKAALMSRGSWQTPWAR